MAVLLVSAMIACVALGDDLPSLDPASSIGTNEADALFKIIRARAASEEEASLPVSVPASLNEAIKLPLILTLFQDGLSRFHCVSTQPTLKECAEEAGDKLKLFLARSPLGKKMSDEGRISLDIVTGGKRLGAMNRALLSQQLAPGVDGLVCVGEHRIDYFTPLTVLRHGRNLDAIERMYISQASVMPPERFAAATLRTLSFVEATPNGSALGIDRGNVPIHSLQAYDMVQAMSRAGMWLLRNQRSDGSFAAVYHPAEEIADEAPNDLADHVRTASALQALHTLP